MSPVASGSSISAPRTVVARKDWVCWSCREKIEAGGTYVRRVVFPNMETNQSSAPVVYRKHPDCGRLW